MKKPQLRNIGFIGFVILLTVIVLSLAQGGTELTEISLSETVERANEGQLSEIRVQGSELLIIEQGNEEPTLKSRKEEGVSLSEYGLDLQKVSVVPEEAPDNDIWVNFLLSLLPLAIIIGFFYFMMRQAQGAGNQAMNFGKSKARVFGNEKQKIKFSDVAGAHEPKEELEEIVEFLKFPKKFLKIGAKIPKGVLLFGPPGTGKTMLARAVAGEAGVPFFSISGSEFVEMFVGVGASRVRDLFSKAKKNAPCIIFIDEIDAVGRRRGSGMGGGHDEREQTLNQILVEMDGFEQGTNVIVIAATNRQDVLDPALLRPGRFDRRVTLNLPERRDREAILKVHLKDKPVEEGVELDNLAAKTAGSSGADLANIVNEAAILSARRNKTKIGLSELDEAFEKVAIGPERKSKVMNEKEKELTAYHEAGHTIVGHVLPHSDPIHKVTIISRGKAGGVTWAIPPEDKSYHSILEFKDVLARIMGGRMAEKVIYGEENVTTGAGSDLKKAAELARDMITKQGMGEKLRNLVFTSESEEFMMGRDLGHTKNYSEDTAKAIDDEVANLINEAGTRAEKVIRENMKSLEKLAKELLEKETLDEDEIKELLGDAKVPKSVALS